VPGGKTGTDRSPAIDWRQEASRLIMSTARTPVVGVLLEVPVMLSVARIVNASRNWYERGAPPAQHSKEIQ